MHISKCGGSSVNRFLKLNHRMSNWWYCCDRTYFDSSLFHEWDLAPQVLSYEMGLQHLHHADDLEDLCVWGVVREPVSWMVSAINHYAFYQRMDPLKAWQHGDFFASGEQLFQSHWFTGAPRRGQLQLNVFPLERITSLFELLEGELHIASVAAGSLRQQNTAAQHAKGKTLNQILDAIGLSEQDVRRRYEGDARLYECAVRARGNAGLRMLFDRNGSLLLSTGFASPTCADLFVSLLQSPPRRFTQSRNVDR